jgi:hypothetical protein
MAVERIRRHLFRRSQCPIQCPSFCHFFAYTTSATNFRRLDEKESPLPSNIVPENDSNLLLSHGTGLPPSLEFRRSVISSNMMTKKGRCSERRRDLSFNDFMYLNSERYGPSDRPVGLQVGREGDIRDRSHEIAANSEDLSCDSDSSKPAIFVSLTSLESTRPPKHSLS